MIGGIIQLSIFKAKGFVRLLGFGHFLWILMLPWLLFRLGEGVPETLFYNWILMVIYLNSFSLIIDVTDVIRYILGERTPQLKLEERKRHRVQERIPCNIEIMINDSEVCKAFNISEGGVYVYTDHSFNPGSIVKVSFHFRNEEIEIQSRVKYYHEGAGMGLMFIDLNNTLKTKIKELIKDIKRTV
jgi:hypothetical protein